MFYFQFLFLLYINNLFSKYYGSATSCFIDTFGDLIRYQFSYLDVLSVNLYYWSHQGIMIFSAFFIITCTGMLTCICKCFITQKRYCLQTANFSHLRGGFFSIISFITGNSYEKKRHYYQKLFWLFATPNSAIDYQSAYLHLIRKLFYCLLMKKDLTIENYIVLLLWYIWETNPLAFLVGQGWEQFEFTSWKG